METVGLYTNQSMMLTRVKAGNEEEIIRTLCAKAIREETVTKNVLLSFIVYFSSRLKKFLIPVVCGSSFHS